MDRRKGRNKRAEVVLRMRTKVIQANDIVSPPPKVGKPVSSLNPK